MRSKDIISIIAFITAFAFSAAFASLFIDKSQTASFTNYKPRVERSSGCRMSDKTCTDILALIIQDIRNGEQRNASYGYSLGKTGNVSVNRAQSVAAYVEASSSMQDEHLPADFRTAWREHMKAWREYSLFLDDVSRRKIDEVEFEQKQARNIYDIDRTWAAVLKIGRSYGATSPYIY
jgi:hypothetical protein